MEEKDKQIAELQKQLDKYNKYFNSFGCDNFDEFTDFISTFMLTPHEEQILIKDSKKATGRKEKEIEDLKRKVNCYVDYIKNTDMRIKLDSFMVKELHDKLKTQPAEIVEKIRNLAEKDFDFDTCTCCGEDVHDDVVLTKSDFNRIIDKVLKEYKK